VHIDCASALKAKPWLDDSAEIAPAKASTKPAWRRVLVKEAVMVGSCWPARGTRFLMSRRCLKGVAHTVMSITQPFQAVTAWSSAIGPGSDTAGQRRRFI
jgi:hypothetical protein